VRALATAYLERERHRFDERSAQVAAGSGIVDAELASDRLLALDIGRFLDRPGEPYGLQSAPEAPPGAPIGMPALDFLGASGSAGWLPSGHARGAAWLERLAPYCSHERW